MKILIVAPKYYPDNFTISLIAEKLAFDHEVTLLTALPFDKDGNRVEEYKNKTFEVLNGVKVHRLRTVTRRRSVTSLMLNYLSFWFLSKLWIRRTKEEFDVVYTFAVTPVTVLAAGNLYKKKHHVRHIAHILDLWPESLIAAGYARSDSLIYKIMKVWSKKLYSNLDEALVGSPSFESYLRNDLDLNELKIKYVPQTALAKEDIISNDPYNHDEFNILYCGNVSILQNSDFIVPAIKQTKANVKFYVIGNGNYLETLKQKILDNNLQDKILLLDTMSYEKADAYYRYADAIYLGLKKSTFVGKTIPNKLISSFYYAKPVIAMIDGDSRKIMETTNGGLLVEEDNESLATAINKICKMNKTELLEMGKRNKLYYQEHFDIEIIYKEILSSLSSK